MRKTDKKIDKQIISALTEVCDSSLKAFTGFEWLTHRVNYTNFPKSLKIMCVFDTNDNLLCFRENNGSHEFNVFIQKALFGIDINIHNIIPHIVYDTEENCIQTYNGNWDKKLVRLT